MNIPSPSGSHERALKGVAPVASRSNVDCGKLTRPESTSGGVGVERDPIEQRCYLKLGERRSAIMIQLWWREKRKRDVHSSAARTAHRRSFPTLRDGLFRATTEALRALSPALRAQFNITARKLAERIGLHRDSRNVVLKIALLIVTRHARLNYQVPALVQLPLRHEPPTNGVILVKWLIAPIDAAIGARVVVEPYSDRWV
jgi:hypothetical protein